MRNIILTISQLSTSRRRTNQATNTQYANVSLGTNSLAQGKIRRINILSQNSSITNCLLRIMNRQFLNTLSARNNRRSNIRRLIIFRRCRLGKHKTHCKGNLLNVTSRQGFRHITSLNLQRRRVTIRVSNRTNHHTLGRRHNTSRQRTLDILGNSTSSTLDIIKKKVFDFLQGSSILITGHMNSIKAYRGFIRRDHRQLILHKGNRFTINISIQHIMSRQTTNLLLGNLRGISSDNIPSIRTSTKGKLLHLYYNVDTRTSRCRGQSGGRAARAYKSNVRSPTYYGMDFFRKSRFELSFRG